MTDEQNGRILLYSYDTAFQEKAVVIYRNRQDGMQRVNSDLYHWWPVVLFNPNPYTMKKRKTATIAYGLYEIVYANGRQETKPMTKQQRKGLTRSKAWKNIIVCKKLCEVSTVITIKF